MSVPTMPVCPIRSSHRAALVPSPGAGKAWVSVHESTSSYAVPRHTWVVTLVNRLRLKNVGENRLVHVVPVAQIWSNGTSGQCGALADVSVLSAQSNVGVGTHRSATPYRTRAGAVAAGSLPARSPYSERSR